MPQSLPKQLSATARESLADVRGYGAKAEHHPHVSASQLREVAATALRKTTSQKAAAADIDIHEGRLSHKLQDGSLTLAQLEKLGPTYAAELGRELTQTYGTALEDVPARGRRLIREVRQRLEEFEQLLEHVQ
jgi:hypothetical protein